MKRAVLLHGTGGSDKDYFWFADTKKYLEECGYDVWWPLLPDTDKPVLEDTALFVRADISSLDEEAIMIGHSSACPLILYLLQTMNLHIKQAVLVSGFYQSIDDDDFSELMLPKDGFDFAKIKQAAKEIVLINSDNDPWGCNDKQARPVAEKLGATFILAEGQGHMGSGSFNQPYKEFPLLKNLLAV